MLKKNNKKARSHPSTVVLNLLLNPQVASATVFKLTAKYFLKFDLERH